MLSAASPENKSLGAHRSSSSSFQKLSATQVLTDHYKMLWKKYKLCYQAACIRLRNIHKINCRGGRKHLQKMKRLGKVFYEHEIALQTDGSSFRYNARWTSRNNTKRGAQQRTWPRFSAALNSAVSKRACYRPLTLEGALGKWLFWELLSVASDDMNAQLFSFPTSYTKWDMNKFFLT